MIGLTLHRGRVALDYVESRRIRYVSPLRYAIGTCALWWFTVALQPDASTVWWVQYWQFFIGIHALHDQPRVPVTSRVALIAQAPNAPGPILNYADSILFVIYFGGALWGFHRGRARYLWLRVVAGMLAVC